MAKAELSVEWTEGRRVNGKCLSSLDDATSSTMVVVLLLLLEINFGACRESTPSQTHAWQCLPLKCRLLVGRSLLVDPSTNYSSIHDVIC